MSLPCQVLQSIIDAGVAAPSGDNCQPWQVTLAGDTIRLINIPDRDISLFNYCQRASFIAHGAFIENVVLAATCHRLQVSLRPFPDSSVPDLVAEIDFVPGDVTVNPLAAVIKSRCTNRRRYRGGRLSPEQKSAMESSVAVFPGIRVSLFEGKDQHRLAGVIGLNDRLVFENRELHAFLFDHIRWSAAEAEQAGDGLDIRTLELAAPDAMAFIFLKRFDLVSRLNLFGVSRLIGANAKKLALTASAVGVITMRGSSPIDYLACGRAMERVWLESTRQGLAFQLMTGITCLMGRVADADHGTLSSAQVALVQDGRRTLAELLGSDNEKPIIIFRVGTAESPTARSVRLPVQI